MRGAKGYRTGMPEAFYVVKGVARSNRQLVTEAVEKAESRRPAHGFGAKAHGVE